MLRSPNRIFLFATACFASATLLLCFVVGCGAGDTSCPVTGTVKVNGKPAGGVYIVLHPIAATADQPQGGSAGRSSDDGSFSLRVPAPGEYAVTAFWPTIVVEPEETIEGPDQFQGKHRDPANPISKVAIQDGDNVLPPIELRHP